MRLTLEQLKGMSNHALYAAWIDGKWPFDLATCGNCLVQHDQVKCHPLLVNNISRMQDLIEAGRSSDEMKLAVAVRRHLDELYALRLFYDFLYPQPTSELPEAVATQEASTEVVTERLVRAGERG